MDKKLKLMDLALPIFVEALLGRSMGIGNIYLLSRFNEQAVAAVSVANQLTNFIRMLFVFVTLGTAVVVSQNLGAGNQKRAGTASGVAITLNVGIGIALGILVRLFHRPVLSMMGLSGQVMDYATTYFGILGGACVLSGLNYTLATVMRNYGKARAPMLVFLMMNALNLAGNAVIISQPFGLRDFGISGIAWWTVLSQAVGCIAMLAVLKNQVRLRLPKPFPWDIAGEILRTGILGSGDNFAYSIAQICMTYYATQLGTTSLNSFMYASNLIGFVQIMGFSVGQGTQIMVGRLAGATEFDAAYHRAFRSMWIAMGLNLSVMTVLMIFQRPILHLFTTSEEVMRIVFWSFIVDLVLEFGRPFNLVIGLAVRAAGDVRWAIVASVATITLVLIPLGYVFTVLIPLGVPGLFMALCADEWLRGQLMTARWRSRKWERSILVKAPDACVAEA